MSTRIGSSNGSFPSGRAHDRPQFERDGRPMSAADHPGSGRGTDRFETRTVHAGAVPDVATGAVIPAIQMSTTFRQDAVGELRQGYDYARTDNPTRRALEEAIA